MLSNTVKNIVPSGTVSINARVLEMMDEGTEIINLSVGNRISIRRSPQRKGAAWAMEHNRTRYDKVPGLVELREQICRKLREENGVEYDIDQIVVSNGAKQCILNTCMTLLNPGDEVLIPVPYWVSYPEIVKICGGVPVFAETKRENDFKLTAADIERCATDRTKMLILCNPSNPLERYTPVRNCAPRRKSAFAAVFISWRTKSMRESALPMSLSAYPPCRRK